MQDILLTVTAEHREKAVFPIDWTALLAPYPGATLVSRFGPHVALIRTDASTLARILADHPALAAQVAQVESFE